MSITSTPRRHQFLIPALAVLLLAGACEQARSSNPLSPLIAGPLAGVTISTPKSLEPGAGWKIEDRQQPLTLLMENPSSNSPRPYTLRVQVASDTAFTSIVHAASGLIPGTNGRTTYRLPDKLAHSRAYHWRIRAEDGANSSSWSATTTFEILTPIVIGIPIPEAPVGGGRIASQQPTLVARNGMSSGPHGTLFYLFQLSTSQSFSQLAANAEAPQGSTGSTSYTVPALLPYDTLLYWRARITDGLNTGAWSSTESFRTPLAPATTPPPTGGSCLGTNGLAIVTCNRDRYPGQMTVTQIVDFLVQVTRDLTSSNIDGAPFGMLQKDSGSQCGGYSCDIVCSGNGPTQRQWDVLGDSDGAQRPEFSEITGAKVVRQCVIR